MRFAILGKLAVLILCAVANVVQAEPAGADKQAARSQEQVRRLRQQVQEAQQAAEKVVQEKSEMDRQLKHSDAELGGLRRKSQETARRLAEAEQRLNQQAAESAALAARLADAQAQLASLGKEKAASEDLLATRAVAMASLETRSQAETRERQRCEANNLALYGYAQALLTAYRDKGVLSALSQRDPVFRLGGVKIESVLEEYRDRLDEQKLRPTADAVAR